MKKHLFLIASVFAAVSLQAQAVVNVASDTGVRVKPNTLFYVGGQMKVDSYTNSAKKVSNEGKIKITGNLETKYKGTNNEASFVNEYVGGNYGQLIVKNGTANVNHISSQIKAQGGFGFLPVAIPYSGVTAEDVVKNLFGEANLDDAFPGYHANPRFGGFDRNRLKNALFFWDNNEFKFTHLAKADNLGEGPNAARYYAINTKYAGNGAFSVGSLKTIDGTPINNEVSVTVNKTDLRVMNTELNSYGEAYGSYIWDFTVKMPEGWDNYHVYAEEGMMNDTDFGSRVYNFGNPYTSNINLAAPGNGLPWDKIKVLVQYGGEKYINDINEGQASGAHGKPENVTYAAMTEAGAGDNYLGFVAPFGTFAVKMKEEMGPNATFTFNDKMKTFESPKSNSGGSLVRTMFARANGSMPVINQVGLDLYDTDDNFTGVRTYVVASDIYEASQKGDGAEVYNPNMKDDSKGMYTLQEREDGSVDENLADAKTYINGINANKYIAKPVHLVLQNIQGKYTLKARLNESLENNKNAFYFEDKSTGKVQKVTKDFEYTFNVNGTEKDRFVLYWAATPNQEKVEEVAKQEVSTTVVFKDADTYKVRFDKAIKKADVFVYSISGQLVNTERNIDTSVDYIVPLRGNSSVYIVKVVGDNGQVTTKKVIK